MVCIYCDSQTRVTNSRKQLRNNAIWRRRACISCGAIFTSHETIDFSTALVIQDADKYAPEKFVSDKLFLSIYKSCQHRAEALVDARSLTNTIIGKLLHKNDSAILTKERIFRTAQKTLENFDPTAAVIYKAYFNGKEDITS